jgi:hypothetical protein
MSQSIITAGNPPKQSDAQRFYDFLKRLTLYQSPERLRKHSEKEWGLP